MKTVTTVKDLRAFLRPLRDRRIGLVPTMGYLHEGHVSLIRKAREECDVVVLSVFVNPLQFGPGEDYERYPRDLERDARIARRAYELWEAEGRPHGHDTDHWARAERELAEQEDGPPVEDRGAPQAYGESPVAGKPASAPDAPGGPNAPRSRRGKSRS